MSLRNREAWGAARPHAPKVEPCGCRLIIAVVFQCVNASPEQRDDDRRDQQADVERQAEKGGAPFGGRVGRRGRRRLNFGWSACRHRAVVGVRLHHGASSFLSQAWPKAVSRAVTGWGRTQEKSPTGPMPQGPTRTRYIKERGFWLTGLEFSLYIRF